MSAACVGCVCRSQFASPPQHRTRRVNRLCYIAVGGEGEEDGEGEGSTYIGEGNLSLDWMTELSQDCRSQEELIVNTEKVTRSYYRLRDIANETRNWRTRKLKL